MKPKLVCLPYAGGGASIYYGWKKELQDTFDVIPVDYPGRGNRFCEDFFENIEELAEDIGKNLMNQISGDFILFGHSLGGLVALELSHFLLCKKLPLPKAIIISASNPPHLMGDERNLGKLSKRELMEEIATLGQMEKEVFEEEELYEIISDILYADIQMFSKYNRDYQKKLDIPIVAIRGSCDDGTPESVMSEWGKYTNGDFKLLTFEGNHFFAFNDNAEFIDYLKNFNLVSMC